MPSEVDIHEVLITMQSALPDKPLTGLEDNFQEKAAIVSLYINVHNTN